jgi:hypothetical protein
MFGRQTRTNSAARWMKAAEPAVTEGIQVRQVVGSGAWIVSSGSDATVACFVREQFASRLIESAGPQARYSAERDAKRPPYTACERADSDKFADRVAEK